MEHVDSPLSSLIQSAVTNGVLQSDEVQNTPIEILTILGSKSRYKNKHGDELIIYLLENLNLNDVQNYQQNLKNSESNADNDSLADSHPQFITALETLLTIFTVASNKKAVTVIWRKILTHDLVLGRVIFQKNNVNQNSSQKILPSLLELFEGDIHLTVKMIMLVVQYQDEHDSEQNDQTPIQSQNKYDIATALVEFWQPEEIFADSGQYGVQHLLQKVKEVESGIVSSQSQQSSVTETQPFSLSHLYEWKKYITYIFIELNVLETVLQQIENDCENYTQSSSESEDRDTDNLNATNNNLQLLKSSSLLTFCFCRCLSELCHVAYEAYGTIGSTQNVDESGEDEGSLVSAYYDDADVDILSKKVATVIERRLMPELQRMTGRMEKFGRKWVFVSQSNQTSESNPNSWKLSHFWDSFFPMMTHIHLYNCLLDALINIKGFKTETDVDALINIKGFKSSETDNNINDSEYGSEQVKESDNFFYLLPNQQMSHALGSVSGKLFVLNLHGIVKQAQKEKYQQQQLQIQLQNQCQIQTELQDHNNHQIQGTEGMILDSLDDIITGAFEGDRYSFIYHPALSYLNQNPESDSESGTGIGKLIGSNPIERKKFWKSIYDYMIWCTGGISSDNCGGVSSDEIWIQEGIIEIQNDVENNNNLVSSSKTKSALPASRDAATTGFLRNAMELLR